MNGRDASKGLPRASRSGLESFRAAADNFLDTNDQQGAGRKRGKRGVTSRGRMDSDDGSSSRSRGMRTGLGVDGNTVGGSRATVPSMPPSPPRFSSVFAQNQEGDGGAHTQRKDPLDTVGSVHDASNEAAIADGNAADSPDSKNCDHVDFLQQTGSILALAERMEEGDEEDDMGDLTAIMQELEALKRASSAPDA